MDGRRCTDRPSRSWRQWYRLLLERNADVEAKDRKGRISLFSTAMNWYKSTVQRLLDKRANVKIKDNDEQTALLLAAKNEHAVMMELPLKQNSVGPDSKDKDNRTPLSFAAEKGHEMMMRLLLERNADVEIKDRNS
jgi:ankyrin repeat protein